MQITKNLRNITKLKVNETGKFRDRTPHTLLRANVLVTAKPHPASKARLIIADEVVGGALASPNGLGNLIPQTLTLMSTSSMGVKNLGSAGVAGISMFPRL